jgi:hypothetical protein
MTEEHEELASRGYVFCFDCGDTFMDSTSPHHCRMAIIKNKTTTNADKDVGKKEPSYTVGDNVN